MTEERIVELVGHWQDFFGLTTWDISVDFSESAGENAYARAWRSNTYDRATLHLEDQWREWDDGFANHTIAHEMLHLVARDLEQAMNSMEDHVPRFIWALMSERIEHELEGVIDRIAARFVELANA